MIIQQDKLPNMRLNVKIDDDLRGKEFGGRAVEMEYC
jgi:hypothetical protein